MAVPIPVCQLEEPVRRVRSLDGIDALEAKVEIEADGAFVA